MGFITCMIVVGFIVGVFVSIKDKEETTYYKLISVNGYYVDTEGNFVTEDNLRGKIESNAIPEKSVVKAPSIKKHSIVYVKSFFKFGGEKTEYSVVFE